MNRSCALLACCAVLAACSSAPRPAGKESGFASNVHLTAGPAPSKELFDEIAREDAAFFAALFDACDVDKVADAVTEDFEFYHDKGGLTATSRDQFAASLRGMCERQAAGTDFRARRELVAGSMAVYPLNNYGAVQVGIHRFYALASEGRPEQLTETARFTTVWKKEGDRWRMARALSYDHRLAE
jgi:ketosteroid isomerase-like protein